jgi:lysozyme|tara:strand:+ start:99 stop:539 length:441 start_codon:yes stop_codon:yes gene_type:complete
MDIDRLRQQLEIDEGCKYVIYLDHLNLPTHGIGHLILESDPEYGQPVGTSVSEDRVIECFEKDLESVQKDCYRLYDDFDDLPETVQEIIANMLFNMGLGRMKAFKGMKRNVDARQWDKAADEMVDSRWYNQVGERSKRLVERMRSV